MLLRTRIVLAVLVAICVISGTLFAGQFLLIQEERGRFENASIGGNEDLWNKIASEALVRLQGAIRNVTRNRAALAALAAGDKDALVENLVGTFNRLSTSGALDGLIIANMRGEVRAVFPETAYATGKEALIDATLTTEKVADGLTRLSDGQLVYAVALPVYSQGKKAGAVMFVRDMKPIAEELKEAIASDVTVFDKDGVELVSTDGQIASAIAETLPAEDSRSMVRAALGETRFDVTVTPLVDFDGALSGQLAVATDVSEASLRKQHLELTTYGTVGLLILLACGLLFYYLHRQFGLLQTCAAALEDLSKGIIPENIEVRTRDELSAIAEAIVTFKQQTLQVRQMKVEQERARQEGETEGRAKIERMVVGFRNTVQSIVDTAATAAIEMRGSADEMAENAKQTGETSATVVGASEEASANVQTVAGAAEELSASVQEIGRQVESSSTVAQRAVAQVQETDKSVESLSDSAANIGRIVSLIQEIAENTNLLALNATIEAARAGDAGKGFAVVANEVKNLANQTATATQEIDRQVSEMRDSTAKAVQAIRMIGETINKMNDAVQTIASTAGEQGLATQEIAASVARATQETSEVSSLITGVAGTAKRTETQAHEVRNSAATLSDQVATLKSEVARFLEDVLADSGERRPVERLYGSVPCKIAIGAETQVGTMVDCSSTRVRIVCDKAPDLHSSVKVSFEDHEELPGTVVRQHDLNSFVVDFGEALGGSVEGLAAMFQASLDTAESVAA